MNSNKNWELLIDDKVYKQLDRFPKNQKEKIISIIESMLINPYVGDIQKIKGESYVWRRRVGEYRIFYEVNQAKQLIHVFWTEHRNSKTY